MRLSATIAKVYDLAVFLRLGDYVVMGGKSGVVDHISVCSMVRLAATTVVMKDITEVGDYAGFPAVGCVVGWSPAYRAAPVEWGFYCFMLNLLIRSVSGTCQ